jgi:hypothetical protein
MIEWLMDMEQLVEWELAGETEVLGENFPQCHFVNHKSHMTWDRTRSIAVGSGKWQKQSNSQKENRGPSDDFD